MHNKFKYNRYMDIGKIYYTFRYSPFKLRYITYRLGKSLGHFENFVHTTFRNFVVLERYFVIFWFFENFPILAIFGKKRQKSGVFYAFFYFFFAVRNPL